MATTIYDKELESPEVAESTPIEVADANVPVEEEAPLVSNIKNLDNEEEFFFFNQEVAPEQNTFNFWGSFKNTIFNKTQSAKTEIALIAGAMGEKSEEEITSSLNSGIFTDEEMVQNQVSNTFYTKDLEETQKKISESESPQSTLKFLEEFNAKSKRQATLAEVRWAYAESVLSRDTGQTGEVDYEKISPILKHTLQKNALASEALKQRTEYENSIDYLSLAVDGLEFVVPSGTASEEYLKYTSDIYQNLDKLPSLPFEKQQELIQKMLTAAKEQDTLLFNNNNSFINAKQIDTMYEALQEGASLYGEGYTQAERDSIAESGLNGTIFLAESADIALGVAHLARFLMRRIHSAKHLKEVAQEQERLMELIVLERMSPNNATMKAEVTTPQAFILEEVTETDLRDGLKRVAGQKQTTLYRKQLEREKKELGILENKLSESLNKEARVLANEEKIKFKDALKKLQTERKAVLNSVDNRKKSLQELIISFDKGAVAEADLSRIDTFLRDGRLTEADLITKEKTGANVFKKVDGYIGFSPVNRESVSVYDTLYSFSPLMQSNQELKGGLASLVKATGLTSEEVAERILPTPDSSTSVGFSNRNSQRELNDLIFADEDESTIGMKLGRELEKITGNSLTIETSATGINVKPNDIKESLGTYTFALKDGGNGAFKTRGEAEQAMERFAFGYDTRVVEKEQGFYVEVDVEHYINPYNDTKPLNLKNTPSKFVSWALNHARVVEEDLIRGLWAMKGVNRSTVQKMEVRAKEAVGSLDTSETTLLMKILEKGDLEEREWSTYSKLQEAMQEKVPKKVFESYKELRSVYDEIYRIREANYYNKLRAGNRKLVDLNTDGSHGTGIGAKKSEIDGDSKVYDIETKTLIDKEQLGEDDIIFKLDKGVEVDGDFRIFVRVTPERVKKIPAGRSLNRRTGHVDRMYRDAGWIVTEQYIKKVQGVDTEATKVTHIVQTEKQAESIRTNNPDKKYEISPSRENDELDAIYSDSESVQFGYGAAHMKKRNEQAKGPDGTGTAGILNAFESLFQSIGATQIALDYDAYNAVRVKFMKTFGEYLREREVTQFSSNLQDMLARNSKGKVKSIPKDVLTEMKNHHAYIKTLRLRQTNAITKGVDETLTPFFNLFNKTPDVTKANAKIQGATSEMFIVWNGLYQGVQNMLPALWTIGTGGAGGLKAVSMLPLIMVARLTGSTGGLAKLVGSEALAKELLEELSNNGMIDAVGRSNDFLDLARTEGADVVVRGGKGAVDKAVAGGKRVAKGAKQLGYDVPRNLSLLLQEKPIVLQNVLAYLTEFNNLVGTDISKFNREARANISFQAQKRTQSQNMLDRFSFQSAANPLSAGLQFIQAVYKFSLDTVIEPQWEVLRGAANSVLKPVFDKELKSLGKNRARTADSYTKALAATMVTYYFFGPEGGLGKSLGSYIEDSIREEYPDGDIPIALDEFFEGAINVAINSNIDEESRVDINATMSPAAVFDMAGSMLLEDFPNVNPLGASTHMFTGAIESAYSIWNAIKAGIEPIDEGGITASQAGLEIISEITENFKLLDSAQKYAISYWTGRNATSRTLSGDLPMTQTESLFKYGLGIEPEMHAEYYHRKVFGKFGQESILSSKGGNKKTIDWALQAYARELSNLQLSRKVGDMMSLDFSSRARVEFEEQLDILNKWAYISRNAVDPEYHDKSDTAFAEVSLRIGSPNYEVIWKPLVEKSTFGNVHKSLRIMEQKFPEGQAMKDLKNTIEGYKIMEGKE